MARNIKRKKIKAMTLLSLLIILSMILVIMAATVPIISQSVTKISKGKAKNGEVSLDGMKGYFICYYDVSDSGEDILSYKQIEFDSNDNVKEIGSGTNVNECIFKVPESDLYKITLIGGGGGGASTQIELNPDFYVNENKNVGQKTLGDTTKFTSRMFSDYNLLINSENTAGAINRLFDYASVYVGGSIPGSVSKTKTMCGIDYTKKKLFLDINGELNLQLDRDRQNDFKTVFKVDDNDVFKYDYNGNNCGMSVTPYSCGCTNSMQVSSGLPTAIQEKGYGIKFVLGKAEDEETGGLRDVEKYWAPGETLKLKLLIFASETREGAPGDIGEVREYKTSYIAQDGVQEIVFKPENIGKGGAGGQININDGEGAPGTATSITINGINMQARGGEGGIRQAKIVNYLNDLKLGVKGTDGLKPGFYIPSLFGIKEKALLVGRGSLCTKDGCATVSSSKYPGSSGASSGYHLGTKDDFRVTSPSGEESVALNAKDTVRVELEVEGMPNAKEYNSGVVLYPRGYFPPKKYYKTWFYRPYENVTPQMGNGGRGGNGAILISW